MRKLDLGTVRGRRARRLREHPTQDAAPVEERAPGAATAPAGGATTAGASTAGISGSASGTAAGAAAARRRRSRIPATSCRKRIVYFDYDSYVVKDEYRPTGRGARQVPAGQPQRASVTLQGHTDERGTREYNIALGQKPPTR